MRKIKKINSSKTGQKVTIWSKELVEDVSFRVESGLGLEKKENVVLNEEDRTIVTINQLRPDSKTVFYLK
jgi:hypothetical protein